MPQPMHRRALSADLSAKFDLGPQPDAETVAQHIGLVTDAVVDATLHKYDALHPGYLRGLKPSGPESCAKEKIAIRKDKTLRFFLILISGWVFLSI